MIQQRPWHVPLSMVARSLIQFLDEDTALLMDDSYGSSCVREWLVDLRTGQAERVDRYAIDDWIARNWRGGFGELKRQVFDENGADSGIKCE